MYRIRWKELTFGLRKYTQKTEGHLTVKFRTGQRSAVQHNLGQFCATQRSISLFNSVQRGFCGSAWFSAVQHGLGYAPFSAV